MHTEVLSHAFFLNFFFAHPQTLLHAIVPSSTHNMFPILAYVAHFSKLSSLASKVVRGVVSFDLIESAPPLR